VNSSISIPIGSDANAKYLTVMVIANKQRRNVPKLSTKYLISKICHCFPRLPEAITALNPVHGVLCLKITPPYIPALTMGTRFEKRILPIGAREPRWRSEDMLICFVNEIGHQ